MPHPAKRAPEAPLTAMTDTTDNSFDAIILGGGAAGLMCAIEAGKRGRRVAVLEHAERCGKKILISGGGRCNFTNIYTQPENFICANPHFPKSALARLALLISSRSWKNTASPTTKRNSVSFSAIALRKTYSRCLKPNAATLL